MGNDEYVRYGYLLRIRHLVLISHSIQLFSTIFRPHSLVLKKFLLIVYYWPPVGGVGTLRWTKMVKYISQYGWQPVVYTPSNGEGPVYDESLLRDLPENLEVITTPIWEPYSLYKAFVGRKQKERIFNAFLSDKKKESLAHKFSVFIRGNFFIPDARKFWIKPSVRFLKKYLAGHPVDVIVSSGPPHSLHLIAEKIHQATGIPWIADFRDPWTNIGHYKDLKLLPFADAQHRKLEKKVLQNASQVVAVTWSSKAEFQKISGRNDIHVIPNGFDDADFQFKIKTTLDEAFSIVHLGQMNKERDVPVFWQAIKELIEESDEFKSSVQIRFIGPVDVAIRDFVNKAGLNEFISFLEFVPHAEATRLMTQAQVLLLIINQNPNAKTVIAGKLYEYLASGRPVLTIGPADSDPAKVIETTGGGVVHDHDDLQGIKSSLLEYFHLFKKGQLKGNASGIEKFTRRSLAGEFAKVMDSLCP